MRIFVGNLWRQTTESELEEAFAAYGDVVSVAIIKDRETGQSRGFGFVEMSDDDAAREAMDALNGSELGGRALTVNEARPREPRRSGGDRRSSGGDRRRW